MTAQRLQFSTFVWIGGTLLCLICSGAWLLNGEINIINALASFNTIQFQTSGLWAVPKGIVTFFDAAFTALLWEYPFLSSPWAFPIKFVGYIFSIGFVWAMVEGSKTVISGAVSFVRSLVGAGA